MMSRARGMNTWEKSSDNWMIIYLEETPTMYAKSPKESVRERARETGQTLYKSAIKVVRFPRSIWIPKILCNSLSPCPVRPRQLPDATFVTQNGRHFQTIQHLALYFLGLERDLVKLPSSLSHTYEWCWMNVDGFTSSTSPLLALHRPGFLRYFFPGPRMIMSRKHLFVEVRSSVQGQSVPLQLFGVV